MHRLLDHQRIHELLVDAFGDLLAVFEQDFLHLNFTTRRLSARDFPTDIWKHIHTRATGRVVAQKSLMRAP